MTYTELKAKPGEYIWDEESIKFVGRINKDGTEDKRFKKGGICSLLNTIIKETGYIPKSPQVFAKRIADHKSTQYLVKGYGVVVKCYDLTAEMWLAKASEYLGIEGDGISDILQHISKSKATEHKAKIESLALIFGKELKSKKLADLTEVTEFEQRLKNDRIAMAREAKLNQPLKLKEWFDKAFKNRITLMKTALPMFQPGYRGNGEDWVICNFTFRWCLQNKSMKRAVESRFWLERKKVFAELNADNLYEYARNYAEKHWSSDAFRALITIEEYYLMHEGFITEEEYKQAKKDIWLGST